MNQKGHVVLMAVIFTLLYLINKGKEGAILGKIGWNNDISCGINTNRAFILKSHLLTNF